MSTAKTTTKMTDTATGTLIMAAGIMLSLFCGECDWRVVAAVAVTLSSFCDEYGWLVIAVVTVTSPSFCVEYDTPGVTAAITVSLGISIQVSN